MEDKKKLLFPLSKANLVKANFTNGLETPHPSSQKLSRPLFQRS